METEMLDLTKINNSFIIHILKKGKLFYYCSLFITTANAMSVS